MKIAEKILLGALTGAATGALTKEFMSVSNATISAAKAAPGLAASKMFAKSLMKQPVAG